MQKLQYAAIVVALILSMMVTSSAQTYTVITQFNGTNGANPQTSALTQGNNGNIYGVTLYGGSNACSSSSYQGCGTAFDFTTAGKFSSLYDFPATGAPGNFPWSGLTQEGGYLYGTTTSEGTTNPCGSVYKMTSTGAVTTLHTFANTDGCEPVGTLVGTANGALYGTTSSGGTGNAGTVFKITPAGTLTTLHNFCQQANCTDGANPHAALVQGMDGNFYGTTVQGGANSYGTVFKISPTGAFTLLYSFCSQTNCADGTTPLAGLVQAPDGNFYGAASDQPFGSLYGTLYKITSSGAFTLLHTFTRTDGELPTGTPIYASDGNLYGTTQLGGANGLGTVYKSTLQGVVNDVYSFCSQSNCPDGDVPIAGVLQDTNGVLYGDTDWGGLPQGCTWTNGCGVVYSLSAGLKPFVRPFPTLGKVGLGVTIQGTNLTGATSVTFNGVSATFKINSSSQITATVPTGAKTGYITVTTPGGTVSSVMPFVVQ